MAQSRADRVKAQRQNAREREAREKRHEHTERRAGRETARARQTRTDYLDKMAATKKFDGLSQAEKNSLASAAGYAANGKGNPEWEQAFKQFWYHGKDAQQAA